MIDYAINALLVLYVAVMAAWVGFLLTSDLAYTGASAGFGVVVTAIMIPYHLLRRKRDKLRAEEPV